MTGISLMGDHSSGPIPYPKTYMESPKAAAVDPTRNLIITPGSDGVYIADARYIANVYKLKPLESARSLSASGHVIDSYHS